VANLKDVEVSEYLKQCVDMVPEQINEEFSRMSADYAYWNEKYAEANRLELVTEWSEKKAYASAYLQKKMEAQVSSTKTSEATLDAEVKTSQVYGRAVEEHIEARAATAHLKGVLEALKTKREMLISSGAHLRQEMQGDPIIREKMQRARDEREWMKDE